MSKVLPGPGLLEENKKLKILLKEIRRSLEFPHRVACQATNGKIQYEGDDYWFILNSIEHVFEKIDKEVR